MAEVFKENKIKDAKNIVRGMKGKTVFDLINDNKRAINEVVVAINDGVEIEVNPVVVVKQSIPSSPSDSGEAGEVAYDDGKLYICVAEDTWVQVDADASWGA